MPTRVVVDTVIWSLFLRRRRRDLSVAERQVVTVLRELIIDGRAVLLGVVRQELLSGVSDSDTFELLRSHLAALGDDHPPDADDYDRAASFANECRAAGVANSPTDMLICGFAANRDLPILTADGDFVLYADHVPVRLLTSP